MTPTPHDALFKYVFSSPENAASELRLVLPAEISAIIDWPSLELCPGSFVDRHLTERHTDLLFSVRFGARVGEIPLEDLERFARQLGPVATEAYMTTAEMLEKRVEAKGKAEVVLRQLTRRFGTLPSGLSARLMVATSDELDLVAERVLTAATAEDALGATE